MCAKKMQRELFNIPEWVPIEPWIGYVEMRRKIKKPMTGYAVRLAVKKLWELKQSGFDPGEILENSILNSWQGLFEPKDSVNGQTSKADRRAANISKATRNVFGTGRQLSGNNTESLPNAISGRRAGDLEGDIKGLLLSGASDGDESPDK